MMPPKDVSDVELFYKMLEAPSPSEVYDFPRKGVKAKVRIFVLGIEEHHQARKRADARMRQEFDPKDLDRQNLREIYGDLVARELLSMAIRSVDPIPGQREDEPQKYAYLFPTSDSFAEKRVTSDELAVLFSMYQLTQAKYGPYEETVTSEAELTAWMTALVEGASAAPLARCSWQALVASSMYLARRAYILSAALESQRSSLPPTLVSLLDALGTGTTSRGSLPASIAAGRWASRGDWVAVGDDAVDAQLPDEAFDEAVREAARIAEQQHKHGG